MIGVRSFNITDISFLLLPRLAGYTMFCSSNIIRKFMRKLKRIVAFFLFEFGFFFVLFFLFVVKGAFMEIGIIKGANRP